MNFDTLLATLRDDEGWRSHAYQDTEGYWTIGYGFLIDSRKGGGLPRSIGEAWLKHAARERWDALVRARPWVENEPEDVQLALGCMVYQMGVAGVLGFRKMLDALSSGTREEAAREALDSEWGREMARLGSDRAERMAALIRGGSDGIPE